jgi:hypothetical protein
VLDNLSAAITSPISNVPSRKEPSKFQIHWDAGLNNCSRNFATFLVGFGNVRRYVVLFPLETCLYRVPDQEFVHDWRHPPSLAKCQNPVSKYHQQPVQWIVPLAAVCTIRHDFFATRGYIRKGTFQKNESPGHELFGRTSLELLFCPHNSRNLPAHPPPN